MLISDFDAFVQNTPHDVLNYALYLAYPDKIPSDNADEQTAIVECVEINVAQGEARLYPPFSASIVEGSECETLGDLFIQLVDPTHPHPGLRIVAELPLIRDEGVAYDTTLTAIAQIHVATEAEEVWLLLAPASEFPKGALPV